MNRKSEKDRDNHGHHGHQHGHGEGAANIRLAFFMNLVFTIVEFVGGFLTNSLAIISDALHDLGDSFSIGLSWYFERVSERERSESFSFGYRRFSLLGALINAIVLLFGSGFILYRAIPRLIEPQSVDVPGMLVFAVIGMIVNGIAVLRLRRGSKIHERVIMLHLLEDVLGWFAVLIGSVIMLFVDAPVIDPILSLGITLFVLFHVYRNLRQTLRIFLQSTPVGVEPEEIKARLLENPVILDVHDIHIWTMDGAYNIGSLHIVVPDDSSREVIIKVKQWVRDRLESEGIQHATMELGWESEECGYSGCTG